MTLAATYLGANGWLLEFNQLRVLVDPWLKGQLSFPPGAWLLKGKLPFERPVPINLDLLLLTQGLTDHSHPETLELLPRELPVVCSISAAKVVGNLGFNNINTLKPGEKLEVDELSITATAGAPVPIVENGYILRHPGGRLYLEPHGFLDSKINSEKLDAVITPMIDLGLIRMLTFVKGCSVVPLLIERFHPKTILASTFGGDIHFEGALSGFLKIDGSVEKTGEKLPKDIRWVDPTPGERITLESA